MYISTQINHHRLQSVEAKRNTGTPELIRLTIAEIGDGEVGLVANESVWQEVVDKLAEVGIVANARVSA